MLTADRRSFKEFSSSAMFLDTFHFAFFSCCDQLYTLTLETSSLGQLFIRQLDMWATVTHETLWASALGQLFALALETSSLDKLFIRQLNLWATVTLEALQTSSLDKLFTLALEISSLGKLFMLALETLQARS